MQRRRLLQLVFGILAGSAAALLSVQVALADSLALMPNHGQPTDPITATFTSPLPPTHPPRSVLAMAVAGRLCMATAR